MALIPSRLRPICVGCHLHRTYQEALEVAGCYLWTRGGSSLDVLHNTITGNRGNIGLYIRADHPKDRIHLEENTLTGHDLNLQIDIAGQGAVSGQP
jgi:hypothetical protein